MTLLLARPCRAHHIFRHLHITCLTLQKFTGAKFDLDGQLGGMYSLTFTPQFQINMRIAGDGPKPPLMTEVGVLFGTEAFLFDMFTMDDTFRAELQAKLERVGGRLMKFQP